MVRHNYFIQVDDALAWSSSIGGEDDEGIGWFTVGWVPGGVGWIWYGEEADRDVNRQRRTGRFSIITLGVRGRRYDGR